MSSISNYYIPNRTSMLYTVLLIRTLSSSAATKDETGPPHPLLIIPQLNK